MVLERSYTTGKRTLAYHVKNHIIGFTVFGEICLRVINDLVCPNRAQHVQFPCAVHGSHFSSEVPGKLYRKRPDTSTGTMNQDLFSTLDMSFSQQMHCFKSPNRKGGCFLIGHIGRFDGQHPVFRQACVLSIPTGYATRYEQASSKGEKAPLTPVRTKGKKEKEKRKSITPGKKCPLSGKEG